MRKSRRKGKNEKTVREQVYKYLLQGWQVLRWVCEEEKEMGRQNINRTEEWEQHVFDSAVAIEVRECVENMNFKRLIKQGIIVRDVMPKGHAPIGKHIPVKTPIPETDIC